MTDEERQLLEELADRIRKAPASQVDRDADDLIRRNIGARPDALYILTQTVLIQEMALEQAKQKIGDLSEELKRQQPPVSFLGKPAPQAPASGYRASSYQSSYTPPAQTPPPLPQYPQQPPVAQQPQYLQQPSGFSGFLHNAAQTAAGIVAGEVAFSAISSLFGRHEGYSGGYYGGGGGGFLGGGGGNVISPVSETIINNNYYEGERHAEHADPDRAARDSGDNARDDSADSAADDDSDDAGSDANRSDTDSSSDDGGSDSGE